MRTVEVTVAGYAGSGKVSMDSSEATNLVKLDVNVETMVENVQ